MSKKFWLALGIAVATVSGFTAIGVAQEGSVSRVFETASRLVSQALSPQASQSDPSDVSGVESEQEETLTPANPLPITYPNGFTEGQIGPSGVPTYSSEEFVPEGVREGDIDSCATAMDYEKCIADKFKSFWDSQRPAGDGWEELRFGEAPQIWINQQRNEVRIHSEAIRYLDENMHRYVTGIATPRLGLDDLIWDPNFQLSNYDFYHPYNEELSHGLLVLVLETEAETISDVQGHLGYDFGSTPTNGAPVVLSLGFIPPCVEGNLRLEVSLGETASVSRQTLASAPLYFSNLKAPSCADQREAFEISGGEFNYQSELISEDNYRISVSAVLEVSKSQFTNLESARLLIDLVEESFEVIPTAVEALGKTYALTFQWSHEGLGLAFGQYRAMLYLTGSGDVGSLLNVAHFEQTNGPKTFRQLFG